MCPRARPRAERRRDEPRARDTDAGVGVVTRIAEMRTALRELGQARAEAKQHVPHPPEQGLAIEVGSGQAPHPRADVVVEKYVADDFERQAGVDFGKPFVVGDGHALPFADGTFAYTLALHVLEHATDPERFAGELSRVAPAGFVQVPTSMSELTFGWPYHPWLIERDGDTLVFSTREGQRAPVGHVFHEAYATAPCCGTGGRRIVSSSTTRSSGETGSTFAWTGRASPRDCRARHRAHDVDSQRAQPTRRVAATFEGDPRRDALPHLPWRADVQPR